MMKFYIIPPLVTFENSNNLLLNYLRQPGIEPGSIAWKATMLTFTPPTPLITLYFLPQKVLIFPGSMMKFYIIPPLVTFDNSNFLL